MPARLRTASLSAYPPDLKSNTVLEMLTESLDFFPKLYYLLPITILGGENEVFSGYG
jgi:hypothetical protein